MKKLKLRTKLTVDILMFIAFLFNLTTGLAFFFGLTSGGGGLQFRGGRGALESSIANFGSRNIFSAIHDWSGIIFIILIIIHVMLSRKTLVCYFKSAFRNAGVAKTKQSCENV
ncbi:MAG: DUF4405 domain-containing protein [Actinomycetota bacterium]|nr:DUF4405 domain-containing protein [Actinomycetota bacterium]